MVFLGNACLLHFLKLRTPSGYKKCSSASNNVVAWATMMQLPPPKTSLAMRLVIAFILAAVPPILLASTVATTMVSRSVNENIERWLNVTTHYLFILMSETTEHLAAITTLEKSRLRLTDAQAPCSPEELAALADLGAEYMQVEDEQGKVLFSTPGLGHISPEPLFAGSSLHMVSLDNAAHERLAIISRSRITTKDGATRVVTLGSPFAIELAQSGPEPLVVRLFLPEAGTLKQAYSSEQGDSFSIPEYALDAILEGAQSFFIEDDQWTEHTMNNQVLITPIRDKNGALLAAVAVSASILPPDSFMPGSRFLFWMFFLLGTLLSGGLGYVLAGRLLGPIRELRQGVRRIAKGEMDSPVPVFGNDEVAELAKGFNSMAADLKLARSELEKSARRERTRMLGEIALGFAHEIRNPLVVIKTSAEIVKKTLPGKEKEARLLGYVAEEVGRIDTLLSEFLNFAKPAPPNLVPFTLQPLVEEILEISAATLEEHGISYTLTSPPGAGKALGERDQIRQVVLNLMLNAMQAMPEGGTLDLTIHESIKEKRICLDVKDSGNGVPIALRDKIHMPFISGRKNSLGLGLAKVYAVMEEHGGSVVFTDNPEGGTTFTICLTRE